jgi:hypothetical protein
MRTVTNAEFYEFTNTIKKVTERKPHLKKTLDGIELRYIVKVAGVSSTVAVARRSNGASTYFLAK